MTTNAQVFEYDSTKTLAENAHEYRLLLDEQRWNTEQQKIQQEHQQQQQEQEYIQDHQRSDDYNNYYNVHASRRVLPPEAGERIRDAYIDNVSDRMTGAAARIIEDAYNAGMTVEQIIMAIEDTGLAPRPSPAYLRAILQEWARCGISVSRSNRDVRPCKAKPWWR